jgi:hypothetical protein
MSTPRPVIQDKQGLFAPGTAGGPGYPKGRPREKQVSLNHKRATRPKLKDRAKEIQDLLAPEAPQLMRQLIEQAKDGDVGAARIALSYIAAPQSNKTIVNLPGLDQMHPEDRIGVINRAVTAGEIPIEAGQALVNLARAEAEAEVLGPIRKALAALKTTGDINVLARHLSAVVKTIPAEGDCSEPIEGSDQ